MLFNIIDALRIKKHYEYLIGNKMDGGEGNITGIFFCPKGTVQKAIDSILESNFNERMPLVETNNDEEVNIEIYVYSYSNGNVGYNELDKYLTRAKIDKIY